MRSLFDKNVGNIFERPKDGPAGARAWIARVIPLSPTNCRYIRSYGTVYLNNYPLGDCHHEYKTTCGKK